MNKIIGTITHYEGTEHAYLVGHDLRIVAIIKGGNDPTVEADDVQILRSDAEVEASGGVTDRDRVEVQPWVEIDGGRFSFVTSDPKAVDLKAFAHLREA